MSASIYIRPVSDTHIPVGAPSRFLDLMANALDRDPPYELGAGDITALMVASRRTDQVQFKEVLAQIVQAIETLGTIHFWAEY